MKHMKNFQHMRCLLFLLLLFVGLPLFGQETCLLEQSANQRIDLWPMGKQPLSMLQGDDLPADSIQRSRIWRCGVPRLYLFQPVQEERSQTAVIVIPGGGYVKQAYEVSGITIAQWLNSIGITAFVLLHRLPNQPELTDPWKATMQDCQRAVKWVRGHAADLGLAADRIGVMGTSAGAHLAACVSTLQDDWAAIGDSLDGVSPQPDFAMLVSPIINEIEPETAGKRKDLCGVTADDETWRRLFSIDSEVGPKNPPTLLLHAADDPAVPVLNSVKMFEALQRAGVSGCSLHVFPQGKHSISMRNQPGTTALWPEIAELWMHEIKKF